MTKNVEKKIVEEIVKERVKENQELFTEEEIKYIKKNIKTIKKIYLIGLINGRQIYK